MELVIPSIQEELNRKVTNALSTLVNGYQSGKLTAEHLSVGADVLFEAVSGLVDKSFIELISELDGLTKEVKKTERSVLMMGKTVVVLTRHLGASTVDMQKIVDGVREEKSYTYDSNSEASRRYQGMLDTMKNNGWITL